MRSFLVQGMAWGDESKGCVVDKLCREFSVDLIVRFCGGAQAAHHVQLENGTTHCFSQFGAGMLANNKVRTHLSRFMLVEPFSMMKEADALGRLIENVWERTTVDAGAVIIVPLYRYLNRLREEWRGAAAHGSCGRGIGVAREMQIVYGDKIMLARDAHSVRRTTEKLNFTEATLLPEINSLETILRKPLTQRSKHFIDLAHSYMNWPARIIDGPESGQCMVFEGAQGVMLDEKHGMAPHNTWTNTTFENADTLLDEIGCKDRYRIGCFRTYFTRHGAGPFPTEEAGLDLPEPHNGGDGFQGRFRVGRFDYRMARKALEIVKRVDCLSVSHLDYLPRLGLDEHDFIEHLESELDTPIGIFGRGPTAAHRTINLEVCDVV